MNAEIIADFTLDQYHGGAEMVDNTLSKALNIPIITCNRLNSIGHIDPNKKYLCTNTTHLAPHIRQMLFHYRNYIIYEHDYKFHASRQPNLFPNCMVPEDEMINRDYYSNAFAVMLQSMDQYQCFMNNNIQMRSIVLLGSIWSNSELELLEKLCNTSVNVKDKVAICHHEHPAKGMQRAIDFCNRSKLQYDIIPKMPHVQFLTTLREYRSLAFFPIVKESFCRLVVEAKALGLTVFTDPHYGVTRDVFYNTSKPGLDFIRLLKGYTSMNLDRIRGHLV